MSHALHPLLTATACVGHSALMNRKMRLLTFRTAEKTPRSPLDDLLDSIDDPLGENASFLFENSGAPEPSRFQEENDEYLLVLERGSLFIDGLAGVTDVLVAEETAGLATLLANGDQAQPESCASGASIPRVRNVEVLLTGNTGISRKSELPALGIRADSRALCLDARWKFLAPKPETGAHPTEIWIWPHRRLRLETTLPVRRMQAEMESGTEPDSGEGGE